MSSFSYQCQKYCLLLVFIIIYSAEKISQSDHFNLHICMFFILILCQWHSEIYMASFPLDKKKNTNAH